MLDQNDLLIRKDVGLNHGDKIHVEDTGSGPHSVLSTLYQQVYHI